MLAECSPRFFCTCFPYNFTAEKSERRQITAEKRVKVVGNISIQHALREESQRLLNLSNNRKLHLLYRMGSVSQHHKGISRNPAPVTTVWWRLCLAPSPHSPGSPPSTPPAHRNLPALFFLPPPPLWRDSLLHRLRGQPCLIVPLQHFSTSLNTLIALISQAAHMLSVCLDCSIPTPSGSPPYPSCRKPPATPTNPLRCCRTLFSVPG